MTGKTAALAIYDFDGTMIDGDSIAAYLMFAWRRGCLSLPGLLRAAVCGLLQRLGRLTAERAKGQALRFRQRMTPEAREALDDAFADRLMAKLRPAAVRQMAADCATGRVMVLLSASTDNYMVPLNRRLGFDLLVCTREADLARAGTNCRGAEKVRRLREALAERELTADWARSQAYADSSSDGPVLQLVGHPVLVCPGRRTLRKLGKQYPTEDWKR